MTFYTWMMRNYKGDESPAGDLAADMYWDKDRFPRNGTGKFQGWHKHSFNNNCCVAINNYYF